MSLNATRLAAALVTPIANAFLASGAVASASLTALSTNLASAIATAVIAEITANASVIPTLLVAPPGGGFVAGTGTVA